MKKTKGLMLIAVIVISTLAGCAAKEDNKSTSPQVEDNTMLESKEIVPETEETTKSEEISINLDEEITAIEEAALEIQNDLSDSPTQTDMNIVSGQEFQLWDDELNSLWNRFSDAASEDLKATVLEEQRAWIKDKEEKVELAAAECEGGSIVPLIKNSVATELTRIRCYELAGYLASATGQEFHLEVPKMAGLTFVDRQGTPDTIYSQLILEPAEGKDYTATIEIYRLTTFEGKASLQDDNVYEFEDETLGVKGIICILDGSSWATFEITESDGSIVNVGEVFEFPEIAD